MPRNTIDLNIGTQYLDNWTTSSAVRELIANAIDEHTLKKISTPIEIKQGNNKCEIIDCGSGITKSSFVEQTNSNKSTNIKCIGLFGCGLKYSMAVLCKNDIEVIIKTKEYIFIPYYTQKANTSEITLHIKFERNNIHSESESESESNSESELEENNNNYGTKIVLNNIKKADIDKSKEYFLDYTTIKFTKLYSNQIMKFQDKKQYIYVNKFKVCTTSDTYFSYNINKTKDITKHFNRDRGETKYTSYKKYITKYLQEINIFDEDVSSNELRKEIQKIFGSDILKEFNQINIIRNIMSQFNDSEEYIFVDSKDKELVKTNKLYAKKIKESGKKIIYIGDGIKKKINNGRPDKIKNIKELSDATKILFKNNKGLFTLESPSMFPPSRSNELEKKIKELIENIKTTLEITISKEVEKTLTTIELIPDNIDESDNEAKAESDLESDNESDEDLDLDDKNEKSNDYYFEDKIFKIKKSFIENNERKNELKAIVFNYILKNLNAEDSVKILDKLMNKNSRSWFPFIG